MEIKVTCPNPLCKKVSNPSDHELRYTKFGREYTCPGCRHKIRLVHPYTPPEKDNCAKLSKKTRRRLNANIKRQKRIEEERNERSEIRDSEGN
jgi:hypothetical protein